MTVAVTVPFAHTAGSTLAAVIHVTLWKGASIGIWRGAGIRVLTDVVVRRKSIVRTHIDAANQAVLTLTVAVTVPFAHTAGSTLAAVIPMAFWKVASTGTWRGARIRVLTDISV